MNHLAQLLFATAILVSLIQQDNEFRKWTDRSGKYTVQAKLVISSESKLTDDVVLVKKDGTEITVPFGQLDEPGKKYVRDERRRSKRSQRNRPSPANQSPIESKTWNWRGPRQDGRSEETGLLDQWPKGGPELVWTANGLGAGLSSVAISEGKIYTLGDREGTEQLMALRLETGELLWSTPVGNGGESNSTPSVDGELVFGLGRGGDLICARVDSGEEVWRRNFSRDFGGKMMSQWGFSESPLVDDGKVICTPGGPQAMIVALDRTSGETIWKTPMRPGGNRGQDGAGYASPVVSFGGGTKQYITFVGRGLISVDAKTGKPLWQYEKIANGTANVPTPIVDGDFVLCSSGYDDGGTALLKLSGRNGQVNWREIYYFSANQLQNHHGGMVKIDDVVYLGEGHNSGFPMCFDFRTGRKLWPKQRGAGTGSAAIVAADGHLYFRYENGVMALIEATASEYRLKGQFRIATNHGKSWPHPVIFDGKLFLRDQHQLHCYSIR